MDQAAMLAACDWSAVKVHPVGSPEPIWAPDQTRADDVDYVAAVTAFVQALIPGGSPSAAIVLGDDADNRVLATTSHVNPDGDVTPRVWAYAAHIPEGTDLP